MLNNKIYFIDKSNDLSTGLALYYQYNIYKEQLKKQANKAECYFYSSNPSFELPLGNISDGSLVIEINESNFNLESLDQLYGQQLYEKTYRTHSIKLDKSILTGPFSYSKLVQAFVEKSLQTSFEHGYLSPFKTLYRMKDTFNAIYSDEQYLPALTSFLAGLEVEPKIIHISEIDNRLKVLSESKFDVIQISSLSSDEAIIMQASYNGFDNMKSNPVVLCPIGDTIKVDGRKVSTLSTQIVFDPESYKERLESIGRGWKERNKTNHSFVEYLKVNAK